MVNNEKLPEDAANLVILLMQQNAADSANLTNQLMDGYRADYEHALRVITAIRKGVEDLFADGYMPTESMIIRALYPYVPED